MVRSKFLADRFFVGLFCVLMASLSGCDFLLPKETSLCHRCNSEFTREADNKIAGG